MTDRNRASTRMPAVGKGDAATRHHRQERVLITTFRGHVTAEMAEQILRDIAKEVPIDMPPQMRPSVWVVDALDVTGFDAQDLRKPGSELLTFVRERIAPHLILLRVESESVFASLGRAAVILFARGICLGNGVHLHILNTTREISPYVEKLRKEGVLK